MNQRALILSLATLGAAACGPAPAPDPKEANLGKAVSPPQTVTCPEGKVLQGLECVAAAAPKPKCPEGQVEKQGQCEPAARICPPGTTPGVGGKTCVVIETPAQRKVDTTPADPPQKK